MGSGVLGLEMSRSCPPPPPPLGDWWDVWWRAVMVVGSSAAAAPEVGMARDGTIGSVKLVSLYPHPERSAQRTSKRVPWRSWSCLAGWSARWLRPSTFWDRAWKPGSFLASSARA